MCVLTIERCAVQRFLLTSLLVLLVASTVFSQGKGVDKQGERVRDGGSNRTPGNNGAKQDTGAGRGFDWGRDKTARVIPLPNPYRLAGRRDVIIKAVQDEMRDRKLIVDEAASQP